MSLVVAFGCDLQRANLPMPADNPIRAAVPAINFHLTPTQRERVSPGFDVDALERLLAQVVPARRQEILSYFLKPEPNTPRGGMLTHIKDPELQALLEEVWAPVWDQVGASDAELYKNELGLPGRNIAIQRRARANRDRNSK
jgi:hypothetical protein